MLKAVSNIAVYGAYVAVALFLGFVLWQALFGSHETEQQSQRKPEHAEQQSPAPKPVNSSEQIVADYTRWLAVFTALLVLATVALFVSGERNVEVAEKSATAAKEAADAARSAVALAETNSERQLRAYVLVTESGVQFDQAGIPRAKIIFKNTGQTPAHAVRHRYHFDLRPYPLAGELDPVLFDDTEARGDIGPQSGDVVDFPIEPQAPLTAQERALLDAMTIAFYIYGEVRYEDAFSKTRTTKYRFLVGGAQPFGNGRSVNTKDGNESN